MTKSKDPLFYSRQRIAGAPSYRRLLPIRWETTIKDPLQKSNVILSERSESKDLRFS